MKYYSQYSQDKIIHHLLKKKDGVFLDIGANDGITISNSYFFEKNLNWTGICIEPIREIFQELQKNRNSVTLNIGVWSSKKNLKFYRAHGYSEMLSGVVDSFNQDHYQRLQSEIKLNGGSLEEIVIEVDSLNNILQSNNTYVIDFCSLDTEGSELEILKYFDFARFEIKLLVVENQYKESQLREFLKSKNYIFLKRLGGDDLFILSKYQKNIIIKWRIFTWDFTEKITQKIDFVKNTILRISKRRNG